MTAADLAGLSQRGCVRFAVACAAHIPQSPADHDALEAVRAWLRCPCAPCAARAKRAAKAAYSTGTAHYAARATASATNATYATANAAYFADFAADYSATRAAHGHGPAAAAAHEAERQWQQRALAVTRLGDTP